MTSINGLYGLFRLDGAPINPRDADILSVADSGTAATARAVDDHAPGALHRADDAGGLTILAGYIEDIDRLASRLHAATDTAPAALAREAIRRFGRGTPGEMIGEWSLLHWEPHARRLTLMMSAAQRDPILFAVAGPRVAVAPDLFALSRIGWIGRTLDDAGLLFALGRASLRAAGGHRTMLANVSALRPGGSVIIDAGTVRHQAADVFIPQPRWPGSFADAVDATEDLLRRIMRSRLARTPAPAVLLSGGLDSSTLAWLAAEERAPDQRLAVLTSVAPPNSGLLDEAAFANTVARRLGLESRHLWPPEGANIYRPADAVLAGANRPPMPVRHCLTGTFQTHAKAIGATLMFDGNYGELTATGKMPLNTLPRRLRGIAGRVRRYGAPPPDDAPGGDFHVRLSPARLGSLPEALRTPPVRARPGTRRPSDLWGYMPGADKAMFQANQLHAGALRMELPYRDLRLLRLFAGFPATFLVHDGLDRAPARHMLAGRLPDDIRLRRSGKPASPDHMARLQRQAPAARARIDAFRRAEVGDWLDLDWLDETLACVGARGARSFAEAYEVQLTAIAAEFLTWWRERA